MNPASARNIRFVGHSDMNGKSDGVQVMVHRGYAYVGHGFSNGITTLDVRDPKNPKVVDFIACAQGTRALHLQTHEDLLLAVNAPSVWTMQVLSEKDYFGGSPADRLKGAGFTAGIRVYDLSKPEKPREIGFMPVDGIGPHRIWYVGGRYAYASIHFADVADHCLAVIDMSNPAKPQVVGRCWIPGMWSGGGETPGWPAGKRYALHHALVDGDIAFGAWRDGGLTVMNVADPAKPRILVHRTPRPGGGGTHSPLPLPDRKLLVLADEPTFANCKEGRRHIWTYDVRDPSNPTVLARFPDPAEADFCAKGGFFGPHNLHENRPGAFQSSRLIFSTYYNAGVRVFDIEDAAKPREVAYYVPPNPTKMVDPRPNRPQVLQSGDCYVDRNGLMYLTDQNVGLNILQFEGL
ncbi:MAG TPA: hypothetical protein VH600_04360 [Burkholderiales bacterium]|jgi:hypothetical protein